jgi:predicted RNase H-like HicB family nuclease
MKLRGVFKRENNMRYAVIIEHDPETGSYGAYAPDLPGCGAAADTREEVVALIQEAIEFHLEGLHEEGLPIPEASTTIE